MSNTIDTEKRLRSWGFQEKCRLLQNGGAIFDVGKSTHLASPPSRGIHIIYGEPAASLPEASQSADALRWQCSGAQRSGQYMDFYMGRECPFQPQCYPIPSAVNKDGHWLPAVRPFRQRP
jgi:hypothetical protein